MSLVFLRLARWAENRMPALSRFVATPRVRGTGSSRHLGGTVFTANRTTPRSLVICFAGHPPSGHWLAGSIAVRLDVAVFVPDVGIDLASAIGQAVEIIDDLELDASLTVVVGEGGGAALAMPACRLMPVARMALLYPPPLPTTDVTDIPTTLLSASRTSAHRKDLVALDSALREAGVAVRETEYEKIPDGWARYPRAVRGSRRALDDLVGFLERGIGTPSTFDVIPGWDLH